MSGVSSSRRLTRWISVPTPMIDPAGACCDGPDDEVRRTDLVGQLARRPSAHSGWTTTIPSGCSARKAATCSGRKRWWTEQWPFQSRKVALLTSASDRPPMSSRGFQTAHVVVGVAHGQAGVAAQVLVREEQDLLAAGAAFGPGRNAHSSTARALVDVQTAPPWRPTKAFSAAEEFMYVIGTTGRCRRCPPAPPTPPRRSRCRPGRPSSTRRSGRAGRPAGGRPSGRRPTRP